MKKLVFCLVALLLCSFAVKAQKTSALEAYAQWRNAASEHLGNINNIHYSLATLTQRVDSQTARIDFAVVGQMPSLNLEIRPLRIQKGANGEMSREIVGDALQSRQELSIDKNNPNPIAELTTIIPIDKTVNAVEVEWKFNARGEEMSYKLILPLEKTPSANTLGIIPTALNANLIPLCPRGCYEVSGNNQRCGFFYKCCGSTIGNSVDYTTCRVTCGQSCGEV